MYMYYYLRNNHPAIILFLAILLKFPLALPYCFYPIPYHSALEICSDAAICALALFFILIKLPNGLSKGRELFISALIFSIVILLQGIKLSFFRFDYALTALLPVVLVIFSRFYARECLSLLFPALSILWLLNLCMTLKEIITGSTHYGITGNWNWSATLLACTAVAIIFQVGRLISNRQIKLITQGLILILSIYQWTLYPSRGALLALLSSILLLLLLKLHQKYPLAAKITVSAIAVCLVLSFIIVLININLPTFDFLRDDARYYLVVAALKIIRDNILLGISPELYESFALAANLPEYFLKPFTAERSPHPHNELLFIAASYGIPALATWLYLIFRPISNIIKNLQPLNLLLLFIFFMFFISGMVDVILNNWPVKYLFFIIVGIFWRLYLGGFSHSNPFRVKRICCTFAFCAFLYYSLSVLGASWFMRQAMIEQDKGNKPLAYRLFVRSADISPKPFPLYRAGTIALFDAKDPDLALPHFLNIPKLTGINNYLGTNGMIARIYAVKKQPEKAITYFEKELKLYPYSIINWNFYGQTLKSMQRDQEAAKALEQYEKSIQLKGLSPEHLPYIFKNQMYDLKPFLLKNNLRDGNVE